MVWFENQETGDIYYKASRGSEPSLESGLEYFTNLLSTFGGTIYNRTLTGVDGSYTLQYVLPGNYYVKVGAYT